MKRFAAKTGVLLVALLVLVSSAVAGGIEEAQAVLDKATDTFNARDFETYFSLFTDNVEVFTGVETPLLHKGLTEWKIFHAEVGKLPMARFTHHSPTARIFNGNTVIINAYFDFTVFGDEGQVSTQGGRFSTTLVKRGGKWLIANHHFSPYF